jgi:hypothetical protein
MAEAADRPSVGPTGLAQVFVPLVTPRLWLWATLCDASDALECGSSAPATI